MSETLDTLAESFLDQIRHLRDDVTPAEKEFVAEKLLQYADLLARTQLGEEGAAEKLRLVTMTLEGIALGSGVSVARTARDIVIKGLFTLISKL